MSTIQWSQKQLAIVQTLRRGNADGSFMDLDQLMEALPYRVSKQALQFSLRYLTEYGLIEKKPREKRRGRIRAIWGLTLLGFKFLAPEYAENK